MPHRATGCRVHVQQEHGPRVGVGDRTSTFRFGRVEATLLLAAPHVGRPCGSTLVRATPLCGLLFVPSTASHALGAQQRARQEAPVQWGMRKIQATQQVSSCVPGGQWEGVEMAPWRTSSGGQHYRQRGSEEPVPTGECGRGTQAGGPCVLTRISGEA